MLFLFLYEYKDMFISDLILSNPSQSSSTSTPTQDSTLGVVYRGALDGIVSRNDPNMTGALSLRKLFGDYNGPQLRVKRSSDNQQVDVYFDMTANIIAPADWADWASGSTIYLVTIYDQSTNNRNTTVYGDPVLLTNSKSIRFDTNDYMTTPKGFLPAGTLPYTIYFQHGIKTDPNAFGGMFGTDGGSTIDTVLAAAVHPVSQYRHYWWGNDLDTPNNTYAPDNYLAFSWSSNGNQRHTYINGSLSAAETATGKNTTSVSNDYFMTEPRFGNPAAYYFNGDFKEAIGFKIQHSSGLVNSISTSRVYRKGALDGIVSRNDPNMTGALSLRKLFGDYNGPQLRVKRSSDNQQVDVYFDLTATIVAPADWASWSSGSTIYVVTIYDQSTNNRNATVYGNPELLTYVRSIAFDNTDYMTTPQGFLPAGTLPYTIYFQHGIKNDLSSFGGMFGTDGSGVTNTVLAGSFNVGKFYRHYWWGNDLDTPNNSYVVDAYLAFSWSSNGNQKRTYINGALSASATATGKNTTSVSNDYFMAEPRFGTPVAQHFYGDFKEAIGFKIQHSSGIVSSISNTRNYLFP